MQQGSGRPRRGAGATGPRYLAQRQWTKGAWTKGAWTKGAWTKGAWTKGAWTRALGSGQLGAEAVGNIREWHDGGIEGGIRGETAARARGGKTEVRVEGAGGGPGGASSPPRQGPL